MTLMDTDRSITIVVDPKLKKEIRKIAKADDRSLSSYISRLLAQHVAEKTSGSKQQEATV